jgi:DNA-binding transcriptional LysR family regulator
MFDWEDLRHFAALAQEGSLSAAARRLRVDHATVARRVAALEAALALKLVDRRARSYGLTADGLRVAELAKPIEDQAHAVERRAQAARPGPVGQVTVSAPPNIANTLIAPRLGALRRDHPGITLTLICEKRAVSLSRREADLAVRLSRPAEASLVARRIGILDFALYAAPAYLREHPSEAYEFIAYDPGTGELPQDRWLKTIAGARPIILRISDIEGHRAAARGGAGIAVLPRYIGDADPGLRRLAIDAAPMKRDVWLVVHRDMRKAPLVRTVMDFLAGCFRPRVDLSTASR